MSAPREALERAHVDVVGMIEAGIPERAYVPGAGRWCPRGKRLHVTATRKTGKSLALAVVTPVEVVAAGGNVVVLDRENGAEEFARRLGSVLDAREASPAFRAKVRERLHYFAWPRLSLKWSGEEWAEAIEADLVIFDSTRAHLTPLGLKEDASDDYAAFMDALVDPLMRAGVATIALDNRGHAEDRARGTTAKEDLADIALMLTCAEPFSLAHAGRLRLEVAASRLGDVEGRWEMRLGDGHYGSWQRPGAAPGTTRSELWRQVVEVLGDEPLGIGKVREKLVQKFGKAPRAETLKEALAEWASDATSGILAGPSGGYFRAHSGESGTGTHSGASGTGRNGQPDGTAQSRSTTEQMPIPGTNGTARAAPHSAERGSPLGREPLYEGEPEKATSAHRREGDAP
jgi:hypothetical protein